MYFCSMKSPYQEIKGLLMEGNMSEGEAKAVALMLLEKVAGLPTAKALIADGNDLLCRRQSLLELAARVAQGGKGIDCRRQRPALPTANFA